mgnify:CR=1 FL=1
MPRIQTTYAETMDEGRAGMIVNTELKNLISRNVEGADGIGFGKAVARGTLDRSARVTTTGDTKILGISVRERSVDANDEDNIAEGRELRVMTKGVTYVTVSGAVVQGEAVHLAVATGVWSNAGGITVANAEFETSAADGELARVRLS